MIELKGSIGKMHFSGKLEFPKKENSVLPNVTAPSKPAEAATTPKPEIELSMEEKAILKQIETMEQIADAFDNGLDVKDGKVLNEKITLSTLQQFLAELGSLARTIEYRKYFSDKNIPMLQRVGDIWKKIDGLTNYIVDKALGEVIDPNKLKQLREDNDIVLRTDNYLKTLLTQINTIVENSTAVGNGTLTLTNDRSFILNRTNLSNTIGHLVFCVNSLAAYVDATDTDFSPSVFKFISQLQQHLDAIDKVRAHEEPKTLPSYDLLEEAGGKVRNKLLQLSQNIEAKMGSEINVNKAKRLSARKTLRLPLSTDSFDYTD